MRSTIYSVAAVTMLAASCSAAPTITAIVAPAGFGTQPRGISRDGSTVVGFISSLTTGDNSAFRWRTTGMEPLPISGGGRAMAYAANANGSMVTGLADLPSTAGRAVRWTPGGVENLGILPGYVASEGTAMSSSGSVVAGNLYRSSGRSRAFRWVEGVGMQELGAGTPGVEMFATDMSDDGSVVIGHGNGSGWRWTASGGVEIISGARELRPFAVSGNGSVMTGQYGNHAMRWTASGGIQDLGLLGPADQGAVGWGITADGSMIVGESSIAAFLWRSDLGMVNLNTYLAAQGVDMSGWNLTQALGVSADGSTIMGFGGYQGQSVGWYVSGLPAVPAPGGVGLLGLAGVACSRRRRTIGTRNERSGELSSCRLSLCINRKS